MFYYKAEATFTINGAEVTINGCKASERNYSHAVITVSSDVNEFYLDTEERNSHYGQAISFISFHQGLENAQKAAKSSHATLGGKGYRDRKYNIKRNVNPNADIRIVETTLVDSKTYRNFNTTYIDHYGQVKGGN
jgi:hypothetical protein